MSVVFILSALIVSAQPEAEWPHSNQYELVARHGISSLGRYQGLWILDLYGNRREVAEAHGALIRPWIRSSAIPYYANRVDRSIEQSSWVRSAGFLEGLLKLYIQIDVFDRYRSLLPDDDRQVIQAFAKAAQIETTDAENLIVIPDASQWLVSKLYSRWSILRNAFGSVPSLGCTSFFVPQGKQSSRPLYARNLDYEGAGFFDRNAAVVYVHPSEPNDHAYISFGSLGLHVGAISGVNDQGVHLMLHQLMVNKVSRDRGAPILSVTERILRRAKNLDEAVAILENTRHTSTWRVILFSANENKTIAVDTSKDGVYVTALEKVNYVTTNFPYDLEMIRKEFSVDYSHFRDIYLRYFSLENQLRNQPAVDVQTAIDLISTRKVVDDEGALSERPFLGTVVKRSNVQSLILDPKDKTAYVAVPTIEFGTPNEGGYVPIPLVFSGRGAPEAHFQNLPSPLFASDRVPPSIHKAHANYRKAGYLITEHGKFEEGISLLLEASDLDPSDPSYLFVAGMTYFLLAKQFRSDRVMREKKLDEGMNLLRKAATNPYLPSYHQELIHLFEARYHFLRQDEYQARRALEKISPRVPKPLAREVYREDNYGYSWNRLSSITIDFTNVDLYQF